MTELSPPKLHLFNAFHSPYGGSELETLDLYRHLSSRAEVRLWTTSSRGCSEIVEGYNLRRARPLPGYLPNGGHYIFVGTHWRSKIWPLLATAPERLVYVYNTFHPKLLSLTAKVPTGWPEPEYVVISEFQRQLLGIDAQVHPSPIDLKRFTPTLVRAAGSCRIGRMSRDTADKHAPEDLPVYRKLADEGVEWHLQGATCLKAVLQHKSIMLEPAGKCDAADFLRSLDIFYYRTGEHVETYGRVVFEAMACGLPVVCHRRGGYADWIEHGHNGLLFDSAEQAQQLLSSLVNDPEQRKRLGQAARETVESIYSDAATRERLKFYTGG